jgi:hypothetical protein
VSEFTGRVELSADGAAVTGAINKPTGKLRRLPVTRQRRLDYAWALECWREMMAKFEAGRPNPPPDNLSLLLADSRQALYDAVVDGDTAELRCAAGRAFKVMGQAMDALAAPSRSDESHGAEGNRTTSSPTSPTKAVG